MNLLPQQMNPFFDDGRYVNEGGIRCNPYEGSENLTPEQQSSQS